MPIPAISRRHVKKLEHLKIYDLNKSSGLLLARLTPPNKFNTFFFFVNHSTPRFLQFKGDFWKTRVRECTSASIRLVLKSVRSSDVRIADLSLFEARRWKVS